MVQEPAYLLSAAASKVHVGLGTVEIVGGDRDGIAGRCLRGGLRLCHCCVVGDGEKQAAADLSAKIFHGFALLADY